MWHNKTRPNKTARFPIPTARAKTIPWFFPDSEATRWVEDAFDHLDEARSFRRVAAWMVENRITQIS